MQSYADILTPAIPRKYEKNPLLASITNRGLAFSCGSVLL